VSPADAGIRHTLGLSLVRQKRLPEAVEELRKAVELSPDNARYVYVYAVALDAVGQTPRAIEVLRGALARHDGNREIRQGLATFQAKAGKS
jgi:Flp pilus assembly protein TadD